MGDVLGCGEDVIDQPFLDFKDAFAVVELGDDMQQVIQIDGDVD